MTRRIKKKADHDNLEDFISDLPRNLIDGILEHLPIRDAVRTSVLSRKWKHMWTTLPRLEFDDKFFRDALMSRHLDVLEIPNVINEVLLLHEGPIKGFYLSIPSDYPLRFGFGCLSKWILYLSRNGINELELVNQDRDPYDMPSHLFSCLDLTCLELSNFVLASPPDFRGFQSLTDLHCYEIRFESITIERFISGCPLLEGLTISYCSGFECLKISAPNLKTLFIEDDRIINSICFKKSRNLVDLTIILSRWKAYERGKRSTLNNFFSCLPKIEKLCLVDGYLKFLSAGCIPEMPPRLINSLKYLELDGISFFRQEEILFTLCLLRSSPKLVQLDIKSHSLAVQPVANRLEELEYNSCSFAKLRTVNIQVKMVSKPVMDLVQFLLANSPSLETLTFKICLRGSDAHHLLDISRELLQFRRASLGAEVRFLYEGAVQTSTTRSRS